MMLPRVHPCSNYMVALAVSNVPSYFRMLISITPVGSPHLKNTALLNRYNIGSNINNCLPKTYVASKLTNMELNQPTVYPY